jgi:hypothetical protein
MDHVADLLPNALIGFRSPPPDNKMSYSPFPHQGREVLLSLKEVFIFVANKSGLNRFRMTKKVAINAK